ncbi:MAG: glycoside hydrolase family 9 protein, partial [Gracilimonas sp.]
EIFNITKEGNFEDEATKKRTGKNIPHLSSTLSHDDQSWFEEIRQSLFEHRVKRIRPLLDDKILTDWNALMIAALAKAGFAFSEKQFLKLAEEAFHFLEKKLMENTKLFHRYNDGEAAIEAMADDYAFLVWALIELYEATFNPEYLKKALQWNNQFMEQFWDDDKGGFWFSITDEDQVYGRQKQIFDGAIPSSNSVAMLNLIRLSRLTGKTELEDYADKIGKAFSADLIRSGASICQGMQSIQYLNADSKEITLAAEMEDANVILEPFRSKLLPFCVLHITSDSKNLLNEIAEYTSAQKKIDGKPALYVCKHFTCKQPLSGLDEIKVALSSL